MRGLKAGQGLDQGRGQEQRDLSVEGLREVISEDYQKTYNPPQMSVEEFLDRQKDKEAEK